MKLMLQRIQLTSLPGQLRGLQVGGAVATAQVAEGEGYELVPSGMSAAAAVPAQIAQGSHVAFLRNAQGWASAGL